MPKISLVIATWNASGTLQRCLDSIAPQKMSGVIEVIVVDGGSKDDTLKIVRGNSKVVDQWISEKDQGIYDAWNKGVKLSTGDWIAFVGADDQLFPDAVQCWMRILKNLSNQDYDFICAQNQWEDESSNIIGRFGGPWVWESARKIMTSAHVASLHSKRLFDEVGPYNLQFRICGDYELLLRKGPGLRSYFHPNLIAHMQIGGSSYSTKALREAHEIRKIHSGLPLITLRILHAIALMKFWRHKLILKPVISYTKMVLN